MHINTGIQPVYEYAGGKSTPPLVDVDGPGTAEAGALAEYIAGENVSKTPNFVISQMGHSRNPSSSSGSLLLIASAACSLVLSSAAANPKRRPEQRTSALVPGVRPPSGEGETDMARKFDPRSGCWKLVDIIEDSGTDKDSKDGAVLPVFDTSETKMNCGDGGHEISKDPTTRHETVDVPLNSLVCEPYSAGALQFLGTA